MKIWSVILGILIIYSAGIVTGAVVAKTGSRKESPPVSVPQLSRIHFWSERFKDLQTIFKRELELSPEQSQEIERIFREHHESLKADFVPRMAKEIKVIREKIWLVLTPEQRARLERFEDYEQRLKLQKQGRLDGGVEPLAEVAR